MGSFIGYEIHAKGKRNRVLALGMMIAPYDDTPQEIHLAEGTKDSFTLWFSGLASGWGNFAEEDEENEYTFDQSFFDDAEEEDSAYNMSDVEDRFFCDEGISDYNDLSFRQKSEVLQIEIEILYFDEGDGTLCYEVYKNGEKLKSVSFDPDPDSSDFEEYASSFEHIFDSL